MKKKFILLQIVFASLLITNTPAQDLYTGVWREGTDGYALYCGLGWNDFNKKWSDLAKQNLRLIDISIYNKNGIRYYNGVWRAGTDNYALIDGLNWNDFVAQWTSLAKQNLRLIDIETYMKGSTRVYAGVWRAGKDGYALYGGLTWDNFVTQWKSSAKQNLRLIDVTSYIQNGTRLYTGVWRAGTDDYALINGLEWDSFIAKWQELGAQNLRLINISSYVQNNKRLYLGVWREGTDGYYLWNGTDFESTTSKWAELGVANLRLINLETYETNCDPTCLNQALMPDDLSTDWRDAYDYHITAGTYHCNGTPGSCDTGIIHATEVVYSWPNLKIGSNYYLRNSVLFGAKDQIFTLPFKEPSSSMGHNGWRYSSGTWHHAIDYYRNDGKTFQVLAAAPGKVIYIGWDYWSGNTMIISHNVGTRKDAYRTIYMHMQNGPNNDCGKAWNISVPKLKDTKSQYTKSNYINYLNYTGCAEDANLRNLQEAYWGKNSQKIDYTLLNKNVSRGQVIGWAGSTGPGGCGCTNGSKNTNTHLHVFFAYRDTDNHWYFFDPYGIYAEPYCYPEGVDEAINGQCARYAISWKGGKPKYSSSSLQDDGPITESNEKVQDKLFISPNPSVGNISVQYTSITTSKINVTIYDKTGLAIRRESLNAVKGQNTYRFNLSNAISGVYYIEIKNGVNAIRNSFIIHK